jgi:hypothetical protein
MAGENTIWKAAIVGTLGLGQQVVNTFHYRQLGVIVGSNPAELLANGIGDKIAEGYLDFCMNSMIINRVEVRQITDPPLTGFDLNVNETGNIAGSQLPPQCAPLIQFRTGLLGRNQRGRVYLPPPDHTIQNAGQVDPAYRSAIEAWGTLMLTQPDSTGLVDAFVLVVYHRETSTWTDATSVLSSPNMQTQRRRVAGVGA